MIKKILTGIGLTAILGVLVYGGINRTMAKTADELEGAQGGGLGRNASSQDRVISQETHDFSQEDEGFASDFLDDYGDDSLAQALPPASGDLSAEESAALLFMREEEKLAQDVYAVLYEKWGLPVFQNISRSEATHTASVKALLDRYGLQDPASDSVGVFTDPALQALYNDLVKQGSLSLVEALKVGAAIEEIDILDLQERLEDVDNADIQQVFNNLLNGSYNHLRAFVPQLQRETGEEYQPEHLSLETYQQIMASTSGGRYGAGGNGRGGNGRGGIGAGGGGSY